MIKTVNFILCAFYHNDKKNAFFLHSEACRAPTGGRVKGPESAQHSGPGTAPHFPRSSMATLASSSLCSSHRAGSPPPRGLCAGSPLSWDVPPLEIGRDAAFSARPVLAALVRSAPRSPSPPDAPLGSPCLFLTHHHLLPSVERPYSSRVLSLSHSVLGHLSSGFQRSWGGKGCGLERVRDEENTKATATSSKQI